MLSCVLVFYPFFQAKKASVTTCHCMQGGCVLYPAIDQLTENSACVITKYLLQDSENTSKANSA